MTALSARTYDPATDEQWADALLAKMFAGRLQARCGELVDALGMPGIVALLGLERVGLLSYHVTGVDCEVVALAATPRHAGVGTLLLDALRVQVEGCRRVWLITTNDNLDALRFYQRRGFRLAALYPGAVDDSRQGLKQGIPTTGAYGIPLRDEIELELLLPGASRGGTTTHETLRLAWKLPSPGE